jgi:hypothetical protein
MENNSYYLEMFPDEIAGTPSSAIPALATDDPRRRSDRHHFRNSSQKRSKRCRLNGSTV